MTEPRRATLHLICNAHLDPVWQWRWEEGCAEALSTFATAAELLKEHPRLIRYRSPEPVLTPESPQERRGTVANVVFPTGIDRRDDLGLPNRFDVYYGMADDRIGVARFDVPDYLPRVGVADPPEAKV